MVTKTHHSLIQQKIMSNHYRLLIDCITMLFDPPCGHNRPRRETSFDEDWTFTGHAATLKI